MKRIAKILSFVLAISLLIAAIPASTYAQTTDSMASVCKHTYKKVIVKPATYPSLKYTYYKKCTTCGIKTEKKKAVAKPIFGDEVTSGSLKFAVKGIKKSLTGGEKVVVIPSYDVFIFGNKEYELLLDVDGNPYFITRNFNNIWINPSLGTSYNGSKHVLTWKYMKKLNSKNQKGVKGFLSVKSSGTTNSAAKIYKAGFKY